jgi:hypothetical protein
MFDVAGDFFIDVLELLEGYAKSAVYALLPFSRVT